GQCQECRRSRSDRRQQTGSGNGGRAVVHGEVRVTQSRCGLVAVIGAPNAGKSTLVNQLVGQKVAITSARAQTTRARLLGIALHGDSPILMLAPPGLFAPKRRLARALVQAGWQGPPSADAIVVAAAPVTQRRHELEPLPQALQDQPAPTLLALNKVA